MTTQLPMAWMPPDPQFEPRLSNPAPEAKQEARVIVALDLRNSSTSVAYLSIPSKVNGFFEKLDDIRILQSWPTHEAEYVPAEISYTPSPKGCRQWGYDIDDHSRIHKWIRRDLEESPRAQGLESLNVLLYQARVSNLADSIPPHIYKSPEQIAQDYLRRVAEQVLDELRNRVSRHMPDNIPMSLVVSHPSLWGEANKQRYFQVVKLAFNVVFPKLRHIHFVGETYANAYWGVLSLWEQGYIGHKPRKFPAKDTSILVCNTGVGPDIAIAATYRLMDIDEDEVGFQLQRVGYESKTYAGWSKVHEAFESLLRHRLDREDVERLFEGEYDPGFEPPTSSVYPKLEMVHGRFDAIKHPFDGTINKLGFPVQLPRGIGTEDKPEMGILNGTIKISDDDLKSFFDPSVDSIVGLLSRQIELADHAGAPVKAIALTGSFARQSYVSRRISELARSRRIDVTGRDGVGDTTGHGSIAWVVGSSLCTPVPVLTMHYGICHSAKFDRTKHRQEDLRISPDNGNQRAEGQIKWLFTKGEAIFPDADSPRREKLDIIRKFRQQDFLPGNVSRIVFVTCTCSVDSRPNRMLDLDPQNSSIFNLDFELSLVPETERRGIERQEPKAKGLRFGKGVLKSLFFDINLSANAKIDVSGVEFSVSCGPKVLVEKNIPNLS